MDFWSLRRNHLIDQINRTRTVWVYLVPFKTQIRNISAYWSTISTKLCWSKLLLPWFSCNRALNLCQSRRMVSWFIYFIHLANSVDLLYYQAVLGKVVFVLSFYSVLGANFLAFASKLSKRRFAYCLICLQVEGVMPNALLLAIREY